MWCLWGDDHYLQTNTTQIKVLQIRGTVLIYFDNEKNALNPVFFEGEAAFSHLSGGSICLEVFQLSHRDLLHTALSDFSFPILTF